MIGFLTQEALGFPYWAWFAIVLGIACILIAIIIIACVTKGKNKEEDTSDAGQTDGDKQEEIKEEKPAEVKEEVKKEKEEVKETKPAGSSSKPEEKEEVKETKPSAKKSSSSKPSSSKPNTSKPDDSTTAKVYHISKRKEDGKWQVKAEGATKALKLFMTQTEAIEYAKKVAGNQEGRIVIHKEGGGFRKLTY